MNTLCDTKDFLVCVRCATYNHAPYIVDAMNGFTMQETNFPFVCIIMDDASTDGEQQVIKNYLQAHFDLQDKTVARNEETDDYILSFAQHKTNRNCFFAVIYLKYNHYSINKSKKTYLKEWQDNSKYIALCEGDDYWIVPNKLQKQVNFLDSHTEYFVCSHNFDIYEQKKLQMKKHHIMANYKDMDGENVYTYTKDNFFKIWSCSTLTVVYRNVDYLHKVNLSLFSKNWDFVLRYFMMDYGKGALFDQSMAVYRIHDGGIYSGSSIVDNYQIELDQLYSLYSIRREKSIMEDAIISRMLGFLPLLRKQKNYNALFLALFTYIQRMPLNCTFSLLVSLVKTLISNLKFKMR